MKAVRTEQHLVPFLSLGDVEVVKKRIPEAFRSRLRDVFCVQRRLGVHCLGSVRTRGRRDINLYTLLPPRISLWQYVVKGQSPLEYGAPRRGQWPPWAVRRFLLYDVFLHELGHLQLVLPKSRHMDRKYAGEKLAKEFAHEWRNRLWEQEFEHPDLVHRPPEADEMETIALWERLNKSQRYQLVCLALEPSSEMPDLSAFEPMSDAQRGFLERALCRP